MSQFAEIKSLHKEGRLIPFVGAGLSMRFDLPSWSRLMRDLATDLGWEADVFLSQGNAMQLAEYYVLTKGGIGTLRSKLDRAFAVDDAKVKASRSHDALVKLASSQIYTTNYDEIIEQACRLNKIDSTVITGIDDIARSKRSGIEIVKFHGSFISDESLVLTESSYFERMDFNTALDIKFRADTLGKTLLFLGYGFNDPNIRFLLYKLHKLRNLGSRETAALPTAFMTTFQANEVQRTVLKSWNVTTVELSPEDPTKSLDEFLESLL